MTFTVWDLIYQLPSMYFLTDARWWVLVACMSTPHWFYAYVWTRPAQFKEFSWFLGPPPVDLFFGIAQLLKLFQFTVLVTWYSGKCNPADQCTDMWAAFGLLHRSWLQLALGVGLLAFGQLLNFSMMKAIGKNGVYYGVRLGRPVPWCTDFPFNVFRHPQYLGASATLLGLYTLIATPTHVASGLFHAGLAQFCFYLVTGWVEDNM